MGNVFDAHANLTATAVATAPSPATSGTSLVVSAGTGAHFPAVPFNATIWPTGQLPTLANAEIVRVTNIATDTLTITRTQEGTSARTVVLGDQIADTWTALKAATLEGAWVNARLAKTSNYTLVNADKGGTIALGGAAFFTLTVGAASGFDPNFQVRIRNEDTVRGKKLSINGITDFILYPGQTLTLFNQNNAWCLESFTLTPRWRLTGAITVYVDGTNGNNANDGLASGAGNALSTLQKAIDVIGGNFDLNGQAVTVQVANGTYTTGVVVSGPFVGDNASSGQPLVTVNGDTTTPANVTISTTSANAIRVANAGKICIQGVKIATTTSGQCISCGTLAVLVMTGKLEFGACAGIHIAADGGSQVKNNGVNYTISGAASYHWYSQGSGTGIYVQSATITISGTPAFSGAFAICQEAAYMIVNVLTFSGSATGTRYNIVGNAVIQTSGGGATYLPGNVAGSTATGGQYL